MRQQPWSLCKLRAWPPCSRPSRCPHSPALSPPGPGRRAGGCRRRLPGGSRASQTCQPARRSGLGRSLPATSQVSGANNKALQATRCEIQILICIRFRLQTKNKDDDTFQNFVILLSFLKLTITYKFHISIAHCFSLWGTNLTWLANRSTFKVAIASCKRSKDGNFPILIRDDYTRKNCHSFGQSKFVWRLRWLHYPPVVPEEVWEDDEISRVCQHVTQLSRPPALGNTFTSQGGNIRSWLNH